MNYIFSKENSTFLFLFLLQFCFGQNQNMQNKETREKVLFSVDTSAITVEEFTYFYKKSNDETLENHTHETISNYLDLYIDFKIKVAEAKSRGLHQRKEFKEELGSYIDNLRKTYLTDSEVTEQLLQEAYDRYKYEIRASHILIKVKNKDTLTAYNKAMKVMEILQNGQSFDSVAIAYSQDPSVSKNKGDLGYFTAFQMIYPFESVAYNTKIGEISAPFRTNFGYHIIKVYDKRPTNGKVQVSHIMLLHTDEAQNDAKRIIDIYKQAKEGEDWSHLVDNYSEDVNKKNNNGILPTFGVAQMPLILQEAAFNLENLGDISEPIKTEYGWHILKLISKEPLQSFEDMQAEINTKIKKDVRSTLPQISLIKRLIRENGLKMNEELVNFIIQQPDSSFLNGEWTSQLELELDKSIIFQVGDEQTMFNEFLDYLKNTSKNNSKVSIKEYISMMFREFLNLKIVEYEENHLGEKYLSYRMTAKEFEEGILLFDVMEEQVWNQSVKDSIGLEKYYEKNKNKYQWDKRIKAVVYSSKNKKIVNKIKQAIQANDSSFLTKQNLFNKYNFDSSLNIEISEGFFESKDLEILNKIPWEKGINRVSYAGKYYLVWILKSFPPRPKYMNEVRGELIMDYQDDIENEWMRRLREKFPVVIDEDVLNEVYEELANY